MKTADKKRILSTRTATGEILYAGKKIPFDSLYKTVGGHGLPGIMLGTDGKTTTQLHVSVGKSHIQLWDYISLIPTTGRNRTLDVKVSTNIPYKEIDVLWTHYMGDTDWLNSSTSSTENN